MAVSMIVVHGAMGYSQESFMLVWQCHQLLSGFLATYPEYHVSHVCQLMISLTSTIVFLNINFVQWEICIKTVFTLILATVFPFVMLFINS